MPTVSNFDELYPGRFLKAGLFKGGKPTLTIKDVDIEEMPGEDGKPKIKAVLSFNERPMQLVMCKTNGLCLKAMFGKELKDWIGKRVTLFAGQWNGEECIRVWGSPDIEKDFPVSIELPRRKPFPMTMHAIKAGAKKEAQSAPDPRIIAAWEINGWKRDEGEADLSRKAAEGITGARYLDYLNALIDESNSNELAGEVVP
jgi:hypothetical protein